MRMAAATNTSHGIIRKGPLREQAVPWACLPDCHPLPTTLLILLHHLGTVSHAGRASALMPLRLDASQQPQLDCLLLSAAAPTCTHLVY